MYFSLDFDKFSFKKNRSTVENKFGFFFLIFPHVLFDTNIYAYIFGCHFERHTGICCSSKIHVTLTSGCCFFYPISMKHNALFEHIKFRWMLAYMNITLSTAVAEPYKKQQYTENIKQQHKQLQYTQISSSSTTQKRTEHLFGKLSYRFHIWLLTVFFMKSEETSEAWY